MNSFNSKINNLGNTSKCKSTALNNINGSINMIVSRKSNLSNKMEGTIYNTNNTNIKKHSEFGIPTLFNSQSCLNVNIIQEDKNYSYLNPEEYFKNVLDLKLLCHKCQKLYTNPIACYKCEKIYCSKCLEWELDNHSKCLYCFNIIFKDIANRVSQDINIDYSIHEIECPYKKCKEIKKLKDIREHIEDCLYRDDISDFNKIDHIEKVVCFDKENDIYVQNHLMKYFKKQYEDLRNDINKNNLGNATMTNKTKQTLKTLKTLKTMKTNRTLTSIGTRYSRYSNASKIIPISKHKPMFNYQSFLDDNEFNPKSEDLRKLIEVTNEYIGKTVFELASKTKETNEKLKKIVQK